jgi:hypothetical protein
MNVTPQLRRLAAFICLALLLAVAIIPGAFGLPLAFVFALCFVLSLSVCVVLPVIENQTRTVPTLESPAFSPRPPPLR